MKPILKIALFATIIACISCTKDTEPQVTYKNVTPDSISGAWQLKELYGQPLADGLFMYVELTRRDKLFTIYENMNGTGEVTVVYTGRYDLYEDNVINGIYDNMIYEYWDHSYTISELTDDRMVWTATDDPEEVQVYVKVDSVPESIVSAAGSGAAE